MKNKVLKLVLFILVITVSINSFSQVDLRTIKITGVITDDASGRGISGVGVSDGFNIVQTDKNGMYSVVTNRTADYIFITVPSDYQIPVINTLPVFYKEIDKNQNKQSINFKLTKLVHSEDSHQLIVYADPQVYVEDEFSKFAVSVRDMNQTIKESKLPSYLFCCGDIVFDQPQLFEKYKWQIKELNRPVFHTKGNHDMTLGGWSMETSAQRYKKEFGPEFYSFNRGKVHYVILDDVMYTARDYLYIGYLSDRQLNWLKQDLRLVKAGATVVVMFHIPVWSLDNKKDPNARGSFLDCLQNRKHLFDLLQPFNAHIFSGHNHANENSILSPKLYEHIHGGICGVWWQADICADGAPAGYAVYEVNGDSLSWYYKSTGKDKNYQGVIYPVGIDPDKPNAFIVNVWNWDPEWTVCWFENGINKGKMTQCTGKDPYTTQFFEANRKNWVHTWIASFETEHLFYAVPSTPKAEIKVIITDRFGKQYTAIPKHL